MRAGKTIVLYIRNLDPIVRLSRLVFGSWFVFGSLVFDADIAIIQFVLPSLICDSGSRALRLLDYGMVFF